MERATKTGNNLCCMVLASRLNNMKITLSWGSVETNVQFESECLNDAMTTPSASDDEPYEC
ncbi:MAG: Uncharacterised protein [Candidatus Poseidoniaceae archaeon]|nr:MAG: Uncharacterised protein [Candidatus Poseidoniaceae archaeon]